MVREKLEELKIRYEKIDVPVERGLREEVFRVSGQDLVPVLQDGDKILADEEEIIAYLEEVYGNREEQG